MLLASLANTWSISDIAIAIVLIAAIVALVTIALRKFGVSIPDWVIQIFWVVVVAAAVIFAIRLLTQI